MRIVFVTPSLLQIKYKLNQSRSIQVKTRNIGRKCRLLIMEMKEESRRLIPGGNIRQRKE